LSVLLFLAIAAPPVGAREGAAGTRVVVVPAAGAPCRVSILGLEGALETVEVSQTREFTFPASAQLGVLVQVVSGTGLAELQIHTPGTGALHAGSSDVTATGLRLVGAVYGEDVRAYSLGAAKSAASNAT